MSEVLTDRERRKLDTGPDGRFYDSPRLVTHADDAFLARLTGLYDELLSPGDRVFDAMSSHVSHLPAIEFERVVGHGMNATELSRNPAFDDWFVQDLNESQALPLDDASFDAVCCALSVQYLQCPAAVFAEFARVLAPDGVLVVSFTNRMFPTKAVRAWRERTMDGRVELVTRYVDAAGGFESVSTVSETPGSDPFVVVVARRA